jgi:hypothetical protein
MPDLPDAVTRDIKRLVAYHLPSELTYAIARYSHILDPGGMPALAREFANNPATRDATNLTREMADALVSHQMSTDDFALDWRHDDPGDGWPVVQAPEPFVPPPAEPSVAEPSPSPAPRRPAAEAPPRAFEPGSVASACAGYMAQRGLQPGQVASALHGGLQPGQIAHLPGMATTQAATPTLPASFKEQGLRGQGQQAPRDLAGTIVPRPAALAVTTPSHANDPRALDQLNSQISGSGMKKPIW